MVHTPRQMLWNELSGLLVLPGQEQPAPWMATAVRAVPWMAPLEWCRPSRTKAKPAKLTDHLANGFADDEAYAPCLVNLRTSL